MEAHQRLILGCGDSTLAIKANSGAKSFTFGEALTSSCEGPFTRALESYTGVIEAHSVAEVRSFVGRKLRESQSRVQETPIKQ